MGASHWIDPERVWDKVVALTDDAVYVANPSSEQAVAMQAALERGEAASTVVKDDVEAILITSIQKVFYDRNDDEIDIDYKQGKEKESKNISFSSAEERDAFAAQLAERLPEFKSKVVEYGKVRAALGPLGFGIFAALATWGLHAAAIDIAAGGEVEIEGRHALVKRMLFWAMDVIGPVGVLVVGALVLALTAMVLVHRVKTPPIMCTMKRWAGLA